MKKFYLILPILMLSCSTPKELDSVTEKIPNREELNEKNMKKASDYTCNVEIINNLMPSTDPERFMYAIVTLLPHSGKLENNWKILSFKLGDKQYSSIDDLEFSGKDELIYRNTVRKIPKDLKAPFTSKVVFENEKGLTMTYEKDLFEIFEVH